ncbi:MAG: hypothetical protein E7213_01170 [Clostridium sp.]|nr:hypothetical protein [Clostridium sp.]
MKNEKILSNEELLEITGGHFIKKTTGKPHPISKYGTPAPKYGIPGTFKPIKPAIVLYAINPDLSGDN